MNMKSSSWIFLRVRNRKTMIGRILMPINMAVDFILALIPKKLLIFIIIALILALYFGFTYEF